MSDSKITSLFHLPEFAPFAADWATRQTLLRYRKAYYDGTIYRNVRDRFAALGMLSATLGPRLYKGTKALFLMLSRAVDVDAGIIPGGWTFAKDTPRAWDVATRQVLAHSNWATDGVLYVHFGAQYGVTGLKVADLRASRRVVITPLDPTCFMLVRAGQYDPTPHMAIQVEARRSAAGQLYEYAEVITPDWVRTFKDGEPDGVDGRDPEYPNALGFVPLVERHHLLTGDPLGECTFQKAMPLLDEVNELASYLADIIKKHAEAQWVAIGTEPSDLVRSGDNVWFVPQGGDIKPIVAGIDIPGVLQFIQAVRGEVQDALPELAFSELKDKSQIATATLELQLMELVLKVKRTRPNYDHGLCDALRMAGRAARDMDIRDLVALDDEALTLDVERPVLPLDPLTKIQIRQAELALEAQEQIARGGESAPAPAPEPTEDDVAETEDADDAAGAA